MRIFNPLSEGIFIVELVNLKQLKKIIIYWIE